jgi:coenzyme PQQ biosynthesis protein C
MEILSGDELEARLRAIGEARYHDLHPFHQLLHGGQLNRGQVQAWAVNRFYYQSRIPMKDAALIARADDQDLRRIWRQRIVDHDGEHPGEGGIERWLKLTDALGLGRDQVRAGRGVLPVTRFAVDAYVRFVQEHSLLEAVASSLTELFAPAIIRNRLAGMLAHYDFVSKDALAYFEVRLHQAPRDTDFALEYVKREARRPDQQQAVMAALTFKCDVLWALLDALYYAYVQPGHVPPGAFQPEAMT